MTATITKEYVVIDGKEFLRITSQEEQPPQPEPSITLHSKEKLQASLEICNSDIAKEEADMQVKIDSHNAKIGELNARKVSIQADINNFSN